jgi:hypothetical protein
MFFWEVIGLREDGQGYENPGFGCLPGMKLHFTCLPSLGLAVVVDLDWYSGRVDDI